MALFTFAGKLPRTWIMNVAKLQYSHPWIKPLLEMIANRIRNRDGVIQQGIGRGLRFNTGNSIAGYVLGIAEPDIQTAFAALIKQSMTVYDLGANVGFLSMIAARLVGVDGHVVSFDPLPANARQIAHNASLNSFTHVIVCEEAVGSDDGYASFTVSDFPTTGKLSSVRGLHDTARVGQITIRMRRLDSLIAELGVPKPDLIKMDVEGAEVDVLAGATDVLTLVRPLLLIELHGTNEAVSRRLDSLNYSLYVLGSKASVIEAHWNARIIAVPRERTDLADQIAALTDPIGVA